MKYFRVRPVLEKLAVKYGLSWENIRAIASNHDEGVSVSTLRKHWTTPPNIAVTAHPVGVVAYGNLIHAAWFLGELQKILATDEPGSFFEAYLDLPPGYTTRPIDLYLQGHHQAVLDLAAGGDPQQILDDTTPGWRESRSDWEVFDDSDGHKSIRMRSQPDE